MTQSNNYKAGPLAAVASLLFGAALWGVIWYPYRLLEAGGLPGVMATLLTYAIALILAVLLFRIRLRGCRVDGWLVAIALSSGACNLGYVLATLHGEIVRVLLLFYLAPFWTVLLARMLLAEQSGKIGLAVVGMSLAGAAIMLWRPELGAPWPGNAAEWLAMATGFLFALSNVLIRRADHYSIEFKSVAVFVGVIALALPLLALNDWDRTQWPNGTTTWLAITVGALLVLANVLVQYGLTRVTASRAIVMLTFELPVAACASWLLAGEAMGPAEWSGGLLIVLAGLASARLEV
jgi:drug/metabolite transporter (DMT)-like permease